MFDGIFQTILVAFSVKTFKACTGMLPSENDDFEFLKTAKNKKKKHVHHVHHSSGARGTVLSVQTSKSLTRNMNVKVAIAVYYIFSKRSKGSLTVWALYAYFSDSQNAAFEPLVWCM